MSWAVYKGASRIGIIHADGNVYIQRARAGLVDARGDVYDRTMTKRGSVKTDGDVIDQGAVLVGSVSPSGDIYDRTIRTGYVEAEDAHVAPGITVFQAGGAALLLW
jgi:hypothetical protein